MGEQEKIKKTTVYLPEDILWALRRKAVEERLDTDSAAFVAAIRCWTEQPAASELQGSSMPQGKWHEMLADILTSGDKEAIATVQQNLSILRRVAHQDIPAKRKKQSS